MQEIKCPKCGEVFQVDESGYAQIVQQVRDREFAQERERIEQEMRKQKESAIAVALMEKDKLNSETLQQKNLEIAEKDNLIAQLQSQITSKDNEKKLAVNEAVQAKQEESGLALSKKNEELSEKNSEIERLKARLDNANTEKQLAISEAVQLKEKELSEKATEVTELKSRLSNKEAEMQLKEKTLQERYETELKMKDELIEQYKDFKARQSTKMIGESLEQHCKMQFDAIRAMSFPNAYFEKDNDISTGSKGDFIFKESQDGVEFISIMFEMKNERDETATKHKNEDFFKELDKDRNEKKCEYAVLVSLLESDSDLYNNGIVDVSYKYPKMFVVRPQFFIPIIALLRNAALNSLEYKKKLAEVQSQQLDLYNFEQNVEAFKESFADSFKKAGDRFADAIKGIDDTIKKLTAVRENLVKSENHLNAANNKLDDVSVKRLTKNAPSVRAMFEEAKAENQQN